MPIETGTLCGHTHTHTQVQPDLLIYRQTDSDGENCGMTNSFSLSPGKNAVPAVVVVCVHVRELVPGPGGSSGSAGGGV